MQFSDEKAHRNIATPKHGANIVDANQEEILKLFVIVS